MYEAVRRLRPDQAVEAAGYVRVSLERQAGGYSPDVQRDAIKRLAAQEGYALTLIEEDHERGAKITRAGYQKIIESVRAGTTHAVLVFMFDRWGRDGAEWLTRAREFERLGVPIISVQEGRDEGGLMRFIRAGMAEEYSRQLAKRVKPSRERAAREGKHIGPTPFGYQRMHEAYTGSLKRSNSRLTVDEAQAAILRDLFARYAAGGWSVRELAVWLNSSEGALPSPRGNRWTGSVIHRILCNPTYIGMIRYNYHPRGLYERCAPEDFFLVEGQHEPLISKELWDQVQERLKRAGTVKSYNRRADDPGQPLLLGTGLFRCAECGGFMTGQRSDRYHYYAQYLCLGRRKGRTMCTARGYKPAVADAALVAEVRRLRGAPWTPQGEARLLGADGRAEDTVLRQQRQLEAERERLRKHTRLMSLMEDDPTPEQIATFREVSAEISGRIRVLEAQLAERTERAVQLPSLREWHVRLTKAEIPAVIDALVAQGDQEGLRELLLPLVASARIVERWPERQPVWARAAVAWASDVQTLLDAGLLYLDEATPMLTAEEQAAVLAARARAGAERLWGRRRREHHIQQDN